MPWQKTYDDNEVLERAMAAFWARGYTATSVNDLVAATGINRGSLYAAYDGKHELFLRALRHYDRIHRAEHLQKFSEGHEPLDAILSVFQAASETGDDRPRGCLIVNTALEMSPHDTEVAALVNRSLQGVEDFFLDQLESAQREGQVDSGMDTRATAQTLLGLFLGLRVLTRSGAPKPTLDSIVSQARAMLT